jgi:aspartyl-tRNA(Asn)/glutamyl-tRNA(Gln) amidotransferase subunit B
MDPSIRDKYQPVIGLEVHAQLLTNSKIFNSDSAAFGDAPNRNVSVITLAHPGTLPKLNKQAVELAIKMGLACHSEISRYQIFDRKNYFYPDLPKGYQITQDRTPVCKGGHVTIRLKDGSERKIILNRIHMEEDAGKSIHLDGEPDTAVDFNRSGVSLIEIVTEPNIYSSEEAGALMTEIRKLVRYLDICDGNMEEGSLRCDANVSVKLKDATQLGKKVEVKNMNSIRNVQRAIDHEIERQINELEKGNTIVSETRTYDANKNKTFGMRTKEELNDYR